jgi:Ca2+-binding EF-hand superfamily protein
MDDGSLEAPTGAVHFIWLLVPAGDGLLELREFLALCAVLQRGSAIDKLKVAFDAWDADQSGKLSADEVETMLRATVTLEEGAVKELAVHSMMQRAFRRIDGADGTKKDGQLSFGEMKACYESDPESRSLIHSLLGKRVPNVDALIGS